MEVDAAAEGAVIEIRGASERHARGEGAIATAVPALESLTARVAVATNDPTLDAAVRAAAAAEGLAVGPLSGDLSDAVVVVDAERQWFKATAGFDATESPRDESMCAHAILTPEGLQVPDTLLDARFADNPAVVGPTRVRFYAGVPLALPDGSRVGTLCVAD